MLSSYQLCEYLNDGYFLMKKNLGRQTLVIYIMSIIIMLGSILLSIYLNNWEWFSRSGALIVVLGIFLTSSQIIENSKRLRQRSKGAHREGNFQRDWANGKHQQILLHARTQEEETWVMGKCGFNLLILGTLIWGFGDLLDYLG